MDTVERPTTGVGLGLAGGILIVVNSLLFLLVGIPFLGILNILALAFGTVAVAAAILMYARPSHHAVWGVVVLVFACLGLVGFGGFIVGSIVGVIGGALGIAWRPGAGYASGYPSGYGAYGYVAWLQGPYGVPVMPWRMCMGCGRWIPWAYNVCPLCGTKSPVAPWIPQAAESPATPQAPPAAPSPVASAPATAPKPVTAPCPTCDGDAEWNAWQNRWYCPTEKKFF